MASLLNSIEFARGRGVTVESVAFVDEAAGPMRGQLKGLVGRFDRIVTYRAGSSRRSWQRHLRMLHNLVPVSADDVIYLVEDDHLHSEHAIHALSELPTEYGLLYSISKDVDKVLSDNEYRWVSTKRGVSSFALSGRAFRRDWRLLSLLAYAGPAFDYLTWNVVKGKTYFSVREILLPFNPTPPFTKTNLLKSLWQVGWRTICNVLSFARPATEIAALAPSGSTHAELGWLAPLVDWQSVARQAE